MTTVAAGIDVSRKTLNIHLNGRAGTATNDRDGLRRAARLPGPAERSGPSWRPRGGCTGRSCSRCTTGVSGPSWPAPRQCRDLPRPGGELGRTDRAGARVPAALSAAFPDMAATAPADVTVDRLRDMPGLREAPVDRRAGLKATFGEVGDPDPDGPIPGVLEALDAGVAVFDRRIERLVRGSGDLAGSYAILTSVPGIGPVTAASLIAWVVGPGAAASRQAAAPGGVAPFARDSGTPRGGRHVTGGRRRPRDVPCMAAMTACTSDPGMAEFYGRLRERGKHHRVAVVAVMRGPVVTANVPRRDRRMWEDRTAPAA